MPNPTLQQTFESGGFVLAQGVYDMISALIANQMVFLGAVCDRALRCRVAYGAAGCGTDKL